MVESKQSKKSGRTSKQHNKWTPKPKHKRTFTRTRSRGIRDIEAAFARLFTGNGNAMDADLVLQEFDYLMTSLKVTVHRQDNLIQPDPTACAWQAAYVNFINSIHNLINNGLDADPEMDDEVVYEDDPAYEEPIRGLPE